MNLDFSTGVQEVIINGKCTVYVNLTDGTFMESIFNAFDALDAVEADYVPRIEAATTGTEVFNLARQRDAEMRAIINELFGEDVCSPVFGSMQLTAAADGLPLWANMLLAFIDCMDSKLAQEKKLSDPRIQKYIKKYQKKH